MANVTPEAQQGLTTMLDRWMGILCILGIDNPFSDEAIKPVTLRGEAGETIVLHAPIPDLQHPDPVRRNDLHLTNSITAHQVIDEVTHYLHVNSSVKPHVLASEGVQLIEPRTTAQAMIDLCLHSEVVER